MQTLQKGDQGFEVELWQGFLIRQGFLSPGLVTGNFSDQTEQATEHFQTANPPLAVDGIVGPHTLAVARVHHFIAPLELNEMGMTVLGPQSQQKLSQVYPLLAQRIISVANQVAHRTPPITTMVDSSYRSFAEQTQLYAIGRTTGTPGAFVTMAKAGQSYHNYGLAVDLTSLVNDHEEWLDQDSKIRGAAGTALQLEWGGNWTSFKDLPHLQLTGGLGVNACLSLYQQSGVEGVWMAVNEQLSKVPLTLSIPTTPDIPPIIPDIPAPPLPPVPPFPPLLPLGDEVE